MGELSVRGGMRPVREYMASPPGAAQSYWSKLPRKVLPACKPALKNSDVPYCLFQVFSSPYDEAFGRRPNEIEGVTRNQGKNRLGRVIEHLDLGWVDDFR